MLLLCADMTIIYVYWLSCSNEKLMLLIYKNSTFSYVEHLGFYTLIYIFWKVRGEAAKPNWIRDISLVWGLNHVTVDLLDFILSYYWAPLFALCLINHLSECIQIF